MTPALAITIASFVFAMMLQLAIFSYYYGRLTMQVEVLKAEVSTRASKDHVESVESNVDKLSALFQKFLTDVDAKLDKVRDNDQRDDAKLLQAVSHLEEYIEVSVAWIGERLGVVGSALNDHDRLIRKVMKITGVSDDRIPAQTGTSDTGQHRVIPPPPKPSRQSAAAVAPRNIVGRKSDPRSE